MQTMAKHQVMNLAPLPLKKQHFDEVYKSNLMEAMMEKQKLEAEPQVADAMELDMFRSEYSRK